MSRVYIAYYRGKAKFKGLSSIKAIVGDYLTRKITKGPYSHCEVVVEKDNDLFDCYTSSIRDNGVRCKRMALPSTKWDLVEIKYKTEEDVVKFFEPLLGKHYDFLGALGIILGTKDDDNKWFCSEIAAHCLNLPDAWRYHPNLLFALTSNGVMKCL